MSSLTIKRDRSLQRLVWAACAVLAGLAATPGHGMADETVAFVGATIETVGEAGRIENGTVVIEGDKIVEVGVGVEIPDTALVVDVSGKFLLPGIVDPYHVVSLPGSSSAPATRTIVIRGRTITIPSSSGGGGRPVFARVSENVDLYDLRTQPLLRSGITELHLVSRGYGESARAWVLPERPEEMLKQPDGFLFIQLTNNSTSLDLLRNGLGLNESRGSGAGGRFAGSGRRPGRSGTGPPGRRPPGSGRPSGSGRPGGASTSSPSQALWDAAKKGEKPLFVNVNNAAAVLHLDRIVRDLEDVRVVLIGSGPNLYQVMDQLDSERYTLILEPRIDNAPYSEDRICVARMAHEAGIPFALSLTLRSNVLTASQDDPLFPVAQLVAAGLPREAALEALFRQPAVILGLEETHGTLAPGARAHVLVYDGDPLETGASLEQVMVGGEFVNED